MFHQAVIRFEQIILINFMKNFRYPAVFIVMLFALSCSAPPPAAPNNAVPDASPAALDAAGTPTSGGGILTASAPPETVVSELYKLHDARKGPFFQTKDRGLVDRFFTKTIADLIWKSNNGPEGEVGAIDFDPLYDSQDVEIKELKFAASDVKENDAAVTASFLNYADKRSVKFLMKRVDDKWKIDDIKYSDMTLLGILKDYYKDQTKNEPAPADGKFEGKYNVGTTSCTVSETSGIFEIRWAKGSGKEIFHSTGTNEFESEADKDGGFNRFKFDGEGYNKGKFLRADGKVFDVSRAK
jgi:hypothetical protein